MAVLGSTLSRNYVINSHALNLLSILFEHPNEGPSVLQWDSFGLLVSLTFSLPSISCRENPTGVPTGSDLDSHVLRVAFACHVVKILAMTRPEDLEDPMDTDDSTDGGEIAEVLGAMGREALGGHAAWRHVRRASLPFLRCCVLFYHYLTDVGAPHQLTEVGGDTFENMCAYLDLPQRPGELFDSPEMLDLVKR